ncbi:hypothetical protein V5O48_001941 [Marasmius crinis-equi]|uniref:non-specific serine/threonine protein kinase n=1 Tax=Marasmius crinis-equi TaxID=585013 RepID=A0ABR3FX34_9AGAR
MLGTRTKRVNAYGKRSQRIVNVSEEGAITRTRRAAAPSIFDDMPPTQFAPLASKMRNRENAVQKKPKHTSPKLITKKQSPLRQKAMSKMVKLPAPAQKSPSRHVTNDLPATPSRAPLAAYLPNLPNSPAVSSGLVQKPNRISSTQATRNNRSLKPFVDTDIIVLDDDGHTISHERRFSSRSSVVPDEEIAVFSESSCSESEQEIQMPRKPNSALKKSHPVIILSDDESSEDEEKPPPRQTNKARVPTRASPHRPRRSVKVEVVIPPPPSPLARLMKKARPESTELSVQSSPAIPKKYQHTLSPIIKPRQLTPLRPHRKALFTPPSPPSPVSDSDLDVVLDLSGLSLDSFVEAEEPPVPEYLRPLLEECQQVKAGLYEFSAFIDTFPYDEVVRSSRSNGTASEKGKFRKVGEASYSEVFGIGDVVLKVIPIRDETIDASVAALDDGPFPSEAKDVLKEIIVTRAMGEIDDRFVKLLRTYVVKGRYPQLLLELWDEYLEKRGSESVRPDTFGVSQAYAIIVLPNGGPDLEAFKFVNATRTGWRQASSVFWQVAKALAHAEQLVSFEHRDLHWGQILVKSLPVPTTMPMQERVNQVAKVRPPKAHMDDPAHGIQVTLIDLGLARMDAGDGAGGEMVHWTPPDDEVFMGEGDYQFDIYRLMQEQHRDHWDAFKPLTNVMWLHYLLVKLLQAKRLKPPAAPKKGQQGQPASVTCFSEKECYECLVDLEQWLGHCLRKASARTKATVKGRNRPKTDVGQEGSISPLCAGEVIEYGIKKGWVVRTS